MKLTENHLNHFYKGELQVENNNFAANITRFIFENIQNTIILYVTLF